jgi:hypothetical protein
MQVCAHSAKLAKPVISRAVASPLTPSAPNSPKLFVPMQTINASAARGVSFVGRCFRVCCSYAIAICAGCG